MMEPAVNRKHKDTLFRLIFREKAELLSLYNAVNGSEYPDPDELVIYTIEDAVYIRMKNDSAFLIDSYLNLYEAQSTWNPNMPLRGVFYLSDIMQRYVKENHLDIFSASRLKLPTPRYIVLYNGTREIEDRTVLRLSDSYIHPEEEPALECVATVLNINYGRNKELMSACGKLYEYAYFIDELRRGIRSGLTLSAAADRAISDCIEKGILGDILKKERDKVKRTLLTEYDEELHISSEKKISYEEGFEEGSRQGFEEGSRQGFERGNRQGFEEGNRQGFEEGSRQGFERGDHQGYERGSEQESKRVIESMLSFGETAERISALTGYPIERILAVKNEPDGKHM